MTRILMIQNAEIDSAAYHAGMYYAVAEPIQSRLLDEGLAVREGDPVPEKVDPDAESYAQRLARRARALAAVKPEGETLEQRAARRARALAVGKPAGETREERLARRERCARVPEPPPKTESNAERRRRLLLVGD
jgi:hypothetical protein